MWPDPEFDNIVKQKIQKCKKYLLHCGFKEQKKIRGKFLIY